MNHTLRFDSGYVGQLDVVCSGAVHRIIMPFARVDRIVKGDGELCAGKLSTFETEGMRGDIRLEIWRAREVVEERRYFSGRRRRCGA